MARARKSLAERIRDCTFEGRREAHRDLLYESDPLDDEQLEEIRQAFLDAGADEEKELALEFEKAVKTGHGRRSRAELDAILDELGPPASAERIIGMFPRFYRLENGDPWVLDDEMCEFIREAHSRDDQGRRVYKIILYGVPKGGAKTPMATGHGLEGLTRNDGVRPVVLQVAGSKKQASLGTQYAEFWVNGTDDDPGELRQWVTATKAGRLTFGRGEYRIESSDGRLGQGPKPTVFIVDEWWLFNTLREREAFNAGAEAMHKEPESYVLAISTETWDPQSQMAEFKDRELREAPEKEVRRDGCLTITRNRETGVLMWWYAAPEDFDPDTATDAELLHMIQMCNPGPWVDHREQMRSYRRSADKHASRRLQLNQRTATRDAWLPSGCWRGLAAPELQIPKGASIYVAIDAALSYDTTAVDWCWIAPNGREVLRSMVWSVRDDAPAHVRCAGDRIDNEGLVEPFIHRLGDRYRVEEIVYDPRYFETEARHLAERFQVAPLYQQSKEMGDAVQGFYESATAGRLAHDGNKILTAHVESTAGEKTERGWKIRKLKHSRPIDACVSGIMARQRAAFGTTRPTKPLMGWR